MHKTSALVATAALISGCANHEPAAQPAPMVGMANPASVFCVQQGGKLRMVKTERGEHGICVLPDGREIEEWAFFRQHHPQAR